MPFSLVGSDVLFAVGAECPHAVLEKEYESSLLRPPTIFKPGKMTEASPVFIWPLPTSFSRGHVSATVSPEFRFISEDRVPTLERAWARYQPTIFNHAISSDAVADSGLNSTLPFALHSLRVDVEDPSEAHPHQLETDESYTLSIPSDHTFEASIHSKTVYGALRGLETFSQLVLYDFNANQYTVEFAPWEISDAGSFSTLHATSNLSTTSSAHSTLCPTRN